MELLAHAGTPTDSVMLGFNNAINSTEVCAAAGVTWALAKADANSAVIAKPVAATPPLLLYYIYLIALKLLSAGEGGAG